MYRYYAGKETIRQRLMRPVELKYIIRLRKVQAGKGLLRRWHIFLLQRLQRRTHIQVPATASVGEGCYIGHYGRVIVNPDVVIGKNVNVATGVTIGQENRGERKGCPVIGNRVWIGTNAVVVGKITIGDDVLIAPLAYVNFDVPDHSIVIGNLLVLFIEKTLQNIIYAIQ